MADELVNVTIDGIPIAVPKGTAIIEAAKQAGVLVPHYCYHPSLPSPAVCRMCLVEVEKAPKLHAGVRHHRGRGPGGARQQRPGQEGARGGARVPADQPPARLPDLRSGRRVRAAGLRVPGGPGRHPLQRVRQALQPGRGLRARRPLRARTAASSAPAACGSWRTSPTTPVLNVSERGDRAFIGIDQSQRLDHPWSGNVVDLCPVGSLLSKDFLHKARAWDLDKTASVCPGCTQGCNINIDTRDDVVVRFRPRPNLEVNRHFMCDYGRMNYRWLNRGDRVEAPLVREGGAPRRDRLGHRARPAGAGGPRRDRHARSSSPRAAPRLESLGLVRRLLERPRSPRPSRCRWATRRRSPACPNLALRRERAPNLAGAELLGYGTRGKRPCGQVAERRRWWSCSTPTSRRPMRRPTAARGGRGRLLARSPPTGLQRRSWCCR